jgi:hypothetical protein
MRKKVLQTNRNAANPAVMPVRATPVEIAPARCTMRCVRSAENPAQFLSSHAMTVRYIAATALENKVSRIIRGVPLPKTNPAGVLPAGYFGMHTAWFIAPAKQRDGSCVS